MAIVHAVKNKTQSKTAMGKVIDYCIQPYKTMFHDKESGQNYRLISGKDCVAETAYQEFMATKQQYGKANGVFFRQYIQSFKPGVTADPKEIHQMGMELAQYFKGFEVLVATHIDRDHWHNHLIVNSVNAETGLKIQFNEKNLEELMKLSDEISQAHGLETLKPYEKPTIAGVGGGEYRAAVKGDSWKFKLINTIDNAMENSKSKADFIRNMEQMGYGVKWIDHYKYITYTTPEGQKCRDNRLHEEKYLKSNMEDFYEQRRFEGFEQAGISDERIGSQSADYGLTAEGAERFTADVSGNRQVSGAYAGADFEAADMGGLDEGYSADGQQSHERTHSRRQSVRKQLTAGLSESDGHAEKEYFSDNKQQINWTGANAPSKGHNRTETAVEVDRHRSIDTDSIIGAALALENLLTVNDQPEEDEKQKRIIERKIGRRKNKISPMNGKWKCRS